MIETRYAGFWIRTLAAIIDVVLMVIVILPILFWIYGTGFSTDESSSLGFWGLFFQYVFPAIASVVFWIYKSATPGKMLTSIKIVDATTGRKPSVKQCVIRYLGYYVASIPLCLGFFWIGFDKRKQGWHDKMAGTVVVNAWASEFVDNENVTLSKSM